MCVYKGDLFIIFSLSILYSGEHLESGIQDSMVLEADESLVVTAQDGFVDTLPDGMTAGVTA